jgi:transcriptional regulator with XRE-family HTH domain
MKNFSLQIDYMLIFLLSEDLNMVLTKLAKIRESRGLSPEQLAVLAGMSYNTVRRAEKGKGIILNNAKAIAKALKLKIDELQ